MARIDPHNRTGGGGENLLSNNLNWNLPLVSLPGRGLDLGLTLSYNSLVWTRSTNSVDFDLDDGMPSPGFRLGFPTVEGPYWNDQAGTNFYMLITPSGAHVELRLTATANVYEAVDSSHLQLQVINNGNNLLVRPTDGTRMTFALIDNAWRCTEVKDRNGNYLTVAYNSYGDIATITDTMLRVVNFNYDSYANLVSITQSWNGQPRPWATFGWDSKCASFPGQQSICGPVLTQVGLPDNSRYNFDYDNGYGQVTGIHYYAADNHQPVRQICLRGGRC